MVDHNVTATLAATAYNISIKGGNDYNDYPDTKFAYESDGTTILFYYLDNETSRTNAQLRDLNSIKGTGHEVPNDGYSWVHWIFIFPELRDISSMYLAEGPSRPSDYQCWWSPDTTNGVDGTWTSVSVPTDYSMPGEGYNRMRKGIDYVGLTGVRAIKLRISVTLGIFLDSGGKINLINMFGRKSVDGDRLALWHPTLDYEISSHYLDWGNFDYGDATNTFRVKNCSPTMRAINPTLYFDNTTDTWTWIKDMHALSYKGSEYGPTVTLETLASKEVSDVVTMRRSVPSGTTRSRFQLRLNSSPTWITYIHNVSANMTAYATSSSTSYRERNADASLIANAYLTDGSLYSTSRTYREQWPYTGSTTTQFHASSASATTSNFSDIYVDEYLDTGTSSLYVSVLVNPAGTATIAAGPSSDLYSDAYADAYGTAGLFAVAEVV